MGKSGLGGKREARMCREGGVRRTGSRAKVISLPHAQLPPLRPTVVSSSFGDLPPPFFLTVAISWVA